MGNYVPQVHEQDGDDPQSSHAPDPDSQTSRSRPYKCIAFVLSFVPGLVPVRNPGLGMCY